MTNVFLLGGSDLEMNVISEMLKGVNDTLIVDKGLKWGARLSAYTDELIKYSDKKEYKIYGIELFNDIENVPSNYHEIDHHNENSKKPSSLEQVAEILGRKLKRHEELVAANDKGYIPAMKEIGATDEEIENIRKADRKAQGVTPEEESIAEKALENMREVGKYKIVKCDIKHFSPIVDRMYPAGHIIIYNDDELTYYADPDTIEYLANKYSKEIEKGAMYFGKGFIGIGALPANEERDIDHRKSHVEMINQFLKDLVPVKIDNEAVFSEHTFFFPFRWKIDANSEQDLSKKGKANLTMEQLCDLSRIRICDPSSSLWKRVSLKEEDSQMVDQEVTYDQQVLYNERCYFHSFCHQALYDSGKEETTMLHFERQGLDTNSVYEIEVKNDEAPSTTYVLDVLSINLNIYSTGIGILTLNLRNNKYPKESDVLRINQFGRRIFPPFYKDIKDSSEKAISLALKGCGVKNCHEKFDYKPFDYNKPAQFLTEIICQACDNIIINSEADGQTSAGIDDRMFVLSWYYNPYLVRQFHPIEEGEEIQSRALQNFKGDDFWYKYVFVDAYWKTCQNKEMHDRLIDEATYARWAELGSLYGISRYSLVMLSNADGNDVHLYKTHMTIYARMVELLLLQRASLLRISSEIAVISKSRGNEDILYKKSASLYRCYILLSNLVLHREVTAQEQGIELYDMLRDKLRIDDSISVIDREVLNLHNYLTLKKDERSNKDMTTYTIAGALIASLALSGQFIPIHWGHPGNRLYQILCIIVPFVIFGGGVLLFLYRNHGWKRNLNEFFTRLKTNYLCKNHSN